MTSDDFGLRSPRTYFLDLKRFNKRPDCEAGWPLMLRLRLIVTDCRLMALEPLIRLSKL
jgi:hypothetical protein